MIPHTSDLRATSTSDIDIFKIIRLIVLPIALMILYASPIKKKYFFQYISLFILFIAYRFAKGEFPFQLLYLTACLIIYDYLFERQISKKTVNICLMVSYYVAILSWLLFRGKSGRYTGFYLDPNLAGYFYFLLFYAFYLKKSYVKAFLLFLLGFFTFSRNFFFAAILFWFFNLEIMKKLLRVFERRKKTLFYIVTISFFAFCMIFTNSDVSDVITSYQHGLSRYRLTNLFDQSNMIRFNANISFFDVANIQDYIWGMGKENYLQNILINSPVLPHNTIIALLISFGVLPTFLYMIRFISNLKASGKNWGIIFGLILYSLCLGTSSYYGLDLIIQLLLIRLINNKTEATS